MIRATNPNYNYITNWANEPTVSELKRDLIACLGDHSSHVANILKWRDLLNIEGFAKPRKIKGRSSVEPRLIRRQAEWRYSALSEPFLSSDRIFQVMPRTYEDVPAAKQNELLLNYQFATKLNKVKFIDDLIRCTVNDGTAIVRLGWERKTEKKRKAIPVFQFTPFQDQQQIQEFQQQADQIGQLEDSDRKAYEQLDESVKASYEAFKQDGQPVFAEEIGLQEVENEEIVENKPTLEILNPENVFIDPSCNGDIDNALFVITSFETNKAFLKSSGLYKNLDKVNWDESAATLEGEYHSSSTDLGFNFEDSTRRKVIAYEYWGFYDIKNNGSLEPIVATWIGDTMIRMEVNPFPDRKLPFVIIQYLPIPRSVYGEPDASLLEENQRVYGAVLRGMIDLLGNSANSQQAFAKGMLDPVNKQKLLRGEDFEFNPNVPIQQGYLSLTYPEIPQSAMLLINLMNQDAEALTGVKSFSEGMSGDGYGNLTAGVKGVLDAAAKREMAILRRLAKGVADIGTKIIAMNYEFLSEQEVVRVTNKNFVPINPRDLKGNFDLIVDINTAEVDSEKVQDLAFLLQTIGPNLEQTMIYKLMSKIAALKRLPDLAEELENYQPQPNPAQEAMAQKTMAEAQKLQAEGIKLQSEAQKLQAEAATMQYGPQLEQAKIQNEQAKAQAAMVKAQADAQTKQMETEFNVSPESHRRNMELIQAQAAGNRRLAITNALLKSNKIDETPPNIDAAVGYNSYADQLDRDL